MVEDSVKPPRVIAPDPALHLSPIARLIAETFWDGTDEATLGPIRDALRPGGSYSWQHSRIGVDDDNDIITHAGVIDFEMRVGTRAELHAAGLSALLTIEARRGQGCMRLTMESLLSGLGSAGYDLSLLFGIDGFYGQFGYRRAWSDHRIAVDATDLAAPADIALEEFTGRLPTEAVELANHHQRGQTGSVVRVTGRFPAPVKDRGYLWRNPGGQASGYVMTRLWDKQLVVTDHAGDCDEVLAVIGQVVRVHQIGRALFIKIPPASQLAHRLRQGDAKEYVDHKRDGDALVRVVNLRSSLEKLIPEMRVSLQDSRMQNWTGYVCFEAGDEVVSLEIEAGQIRVVDSAPATRHRVSGPALGQLLLGVDDPQGFIDGGSLITSGDAADVVRAMFPQRHPAMPLPDRF